MRYLVVFALLLAAAGNASSQVASHTSTAPAKSSSAPANSSFHVTDKPVASVNGAVLTDRDLLREMLQIFPYATQHNGFPKDQEASIRQGALQMIVFEELVYQEAQRRKLTVSPQLLKQSELDFKKQFHSAQEYQQYLNTEMGGAEQNVVNKIKRSLLIEQVLQSDVENKSVVTLAETRAFYDRNASRFQIAESYSFQSISILPPLHPTADQQKEAAKRANDYLKQAQAMKSYEDFGLLAERISEDDFRVNMGLHKSAEKDTLPPQIIKAFSTMKPGAVSSLISIESAYTIVRLDAHTPAGKQSFESVKAGLKTELQKTKYESLRVSLDKSLRAKAQVQIL
jgi:parvulin-like peptidyl-prolyl isomerase